MLSVQNARSLFPLFKAQPDLAFLDSAASAQKAQAVLDAMDEFQKHDYANIHRGLYGLSQRATQAYEDARATVASFINAPTTDSIIFTRNTTEAINLVAQTWVKQNLQKGDAILLTVLEHHANIVPWQMLAQEKGLDIIVADCCDDGSLPLENIQKAWQPNVKFVACTHMSNALGTILPAQEITKYAHQNGAKILLDGSQTVVHSSVDVQALNADFYAFTGHKLYGPTGIGALYVKPELLENMPPYQGGGDMIETVTLPMGTTYAPAPARFEAGTPNIVGAVGLAAAIKFIQQFDTTEIQQHEATLANTAIEKLQTLGSITIHGLAEPRASIVSFTVDGAHPHDIATILDECNVAVRTGHHCAMPLMERLGITGTIRASFAIYNTLQDVEKLVNGVKQAQKLLLPKVS
ncbi:MAG: cysteine desulfurase [Alphaproteobacteria bacterium]|nr:cysteine desulfurase [Alphaproteobacteria bacterium]MDD9919121.1 cysteine desulfurase [Alphaproteobacteria bacterium]